MPIGIFDSGIGGLTAVQELERLVPDADFIYFGDTARLPYGTRSEFVINKYAMQDCRFLKTQNVDAVLVACGTVSSNSLQLLKQTFSMPIVGVIDSAVEKAVDIAQKGNGIISVLGTGATIKNGAFEKTIKKIDPNLKVLSKACPMFVPLVENGYTNKNDTITILAAKEYLEEIIPQKPSAVILGCTHYPLLSEIISDLLPESRLINSSAEAVHELLSVMKKKNIPLTKTNNKKFYVSDDVEMFCSNAKTFLNGYNLSDVKKLDIEAY
ncbi:glutamate racemase [Eubacteriales bacterium OttesenSCG-928-G02]|nr:glutamate racemase [Eubacteriales bacterium OttesenSCG-928-G02]